MKLIAANQIIINGETVEPGTAFECKNDDGERLLRLRAAHKPGAVPEKKDRGSDDPPAA